MKTNSNPSIDPLDPTVNPVSLRIVESLRKDSNTEPQLITIPTYQSSAPQAEHPGINYEDFAPYFKRNFFNYVPEVTEEQRAQNQPSSEQVLRSAGKFIGKTALNTTGGLAGTVYGGIEALANWDFSKMYNNEVVNKIEELKAKMDEAFPVYKTQEFTESGFFKKLFMHPAQFSDEISDALAFTAGAAVTSIITGGIMNATLPVLAMRTLNTLDKTSKAIQGINQLNKLKVLRGITESSRLTGQLFFGANYESIVETKHSMMELEKNLRIAGVPENEIEEIINQAEKFSWATNMGVVGASNFLQFPKIFRLSYGKELSGLRPSDILFEGNKAVAAYTKASKVGKALRTTATAFEKPFIEGVGEEGIQTVISEVSKDYWSRKNDPEARDTVNLFLDSLVKGFKESYGTKEGWNQIGIGMLIGGMGVPGRGIFPGKYGKDVITDKDGNIISEKRREIWQGGIIGSFQEQSNKRAQIDKIVDELNKNPDVLPVIKSYYEGLIRDISIQKDLDRVLEIKDKFEWKNLKNEQVYNWIRTRVKAGLEDVAKDQISKLKDLTAEEFSIELFGADSEVRVNEEEKNKIIEHLLSKVDEIVEATKLVDRTYQTSYKDKEQDPVREQLIYTISGLKDLDQRESQIYERLSKLTNGIINEKLIRPLHYGTYEQIINALKSSVIDAQGEQKQILEELIKIYENFRQSTKDNKGYDINNLNKEENELMKIWMQKHPTEFTIHNKEVTEMIGDLKKIKERRQAFIDQYNYLFTTDGKTKLKTQEEEIQPEEEIQEEFIEEESFDNKIKNLLEIQKTQPLYITHKGKQLKGKLVVNPDNNSVKFITDKIDNKKITFIINEKNVDLIKPIIKSEEEKEEEIFEALEIVTRAFEKVLNERYKEQKELINELEELDNKLFDERLKLIKAQKDLDFKNFDKRTKAYKETKRLIEVHKETIELYKNYKEKLEQRLKDLQQTTQVIENFIITIQSQKFTKEELNAQYKLLQQIIKFHKNETLEELNNLIELTINHIDQTEQKIKLLEDQLIELELLLEQHKEWAEFIDDFIKNKEEFIRTHYGKRAPLRYDIDVVNNFLDWAEKNQKNPNNPLYKKPSIKVLIETLKELTEAEGLRTEIGEIINKLTKEDSAGSIPFTKYELEILKAQLERQYKELKELNDKLELIKTARIIDATWKGATNYFKQVKADIEELKEELRRKKHEQEKNDAIEPDTLSDKEKYNELQTDLKRSEPLSTSGRGYKTKIENGKPVYVRDENGKLIPKENYSEVNFEKFKDKIDISENDLYVKFVTSDKNPEYFTEGELAAEGIVKYVLSKLTEKKIDADKIIADILANKDLSKQVELYTNKYNSDNVVKKDAAGALKDDLIPHIQKLIDAVLLVDSTITPDEIKNISHLAIGIKTVIVNSKGEPYSISGKASKNTPLSEQLYTYYHSAASQHRFKTEDGKPDIKALRKIFTIRNNVVNKGKIFAKINGISRGFYNRKQVDGKPLLQSLKTVFPEIEELFIEIIKGKPRGTWTVRNGKNIKTGTPYVKYKNNYYDVISPTMNDLNKTDVLIDLIIHAVVNYNPGDSLESATILDQNGRSRKIFGKDGLVSTMILWGPSDTYKNKQIFIKANKFLVIGNKEYSIKEIIENQVVREKVKTEIGKLILPISHSRLSSNNAVYEPISVEDGIVHVKRYETYTEFLIENLKSDIVPINDEEQTHLSRYFTFDEPTEFIESPTQAKSQSEIKEPEEKPKWTHRSEYDSDINKDKKGYKQIKVRTKGSKKLEYKLE